MAEAKKRSSRIWDFVLILALAYLGSQLIFKYVFPQDNPTEGMPITLKMQDASISLGNAPVVTITNNTNQSIDINENGCLPFDVFKVDAQDATKLTPVIGEPEGNCKELTELLPDAKEKVDLSPWKYTMFGEPGVYELELRISSEAVLTGSGSDQSQYREGIITRFSVSEPGIFTKTFRAFISKPILNAFVFIANWLPGHSLGWAIVIITLVVKLLLFIPTQHALEGQKKMQMLQPKFEEIRRMHKDNPAKMQEETMKVWKEHKVNPFQACLPMLVQFPVLIGLFYVIRDGMNLDLSKHLLYPAYQNIDWSFNTMFFGLDLSQPYVWIFPPLLVVLQYIQMKLSFMIADKKKAKQIAEKTTPQADTPQEIQQRLMQYLLPLVIGFFAIRFPSAVSVYWGISTLFAIGQQLIVNREHINVRS